MAQFKKVSFAGLQVVKSEDAWQKNDKTGKQRLKPGVVGRVTKGSSAFISSTNRSGKNPRYFRDSSELTNGQKNQIVRLFDDMGRSVVYLMDPSVTGKSGGDGGARAITSGSSVVSQAGKKKTSAGEGF